MGPEAPCQRVGTARESSPVPDQPAVKFKGGARDTPGEARSRQGIIAANAGPGIGGRRRSDGGRNRHGGGTIARPWHRRAPSPIRPATLDQEAHRPHISGTPTSSRSTRASTVSLSRMRRSSGCIPECCGPKGRRGARRGAIWCGATFRTTGRCDGRRTTAASACSALLEQQQRQHVRLPGPAALLRASHAPRRALRARRLLDRDRRRLSGKSSTRRTTSCRIPTAATGSPIRPMAASSTRRAGCRGRAEQCRRTAESAASASLPASCPASANCRPTAIASTQADASISWSARSRCPIPTASLLARLQEALCRRTGKGPGDTGPGGKGDIHVFDVGPTTSSRTRSCSADCMVDGVKCGPDGMRCDVNGNLWASSNAGRPSATAA